MPAIKMLKDAFVHVILSLLASIKPIFSVNKHVGMKPWWYLIGTWCVSTVLYVHRWLERTRNDSMHFAPLHSVSDIKANNRWLLNRERTIGAEIHSSLHELTWRFLCWISLLLALWNFSIKLPSYWTIISCHWFAIKVSSNSPSPCKTPYYLLYNLLIMND